MTGVVPGSAAEQAGLRAGRGVSETVPAGRDVIAAVDDQPVNSVEQLAERLAGHKPGNSVTLAIVRDGGEQQVKATLQAWPDVGS